MEEDSLMKARLEAQTQLDLCGSPHIVGVSFDSDYDDLPIPSYFIRFFYDQRSVTIFGSFLTALLRAFNLEETSIYQVY